RDRLVAQARLRVPKFATAMRSACPGSQEPKFMATLLESLRGMTKVVADSGDFEAILKFKPEDSTTNPSLIAAAAQLPDYSAIVDDVLQRAKAELGEGAS